MRVKIEPTIYTYLTFVCELPFIGKIEIKWEDTKSNGFTVKNEETFDYVKEGFQTYEQAEHWVSEQNYHLVTD